MALNIFGKRSLYWKAGIDTKGVKQGAGETKGIIAGLAKTIGKTDIFAAIGVFAAMAFKKAAAAAYKFSNDFQIAMKEVQTISKSTQADFAGVSDGIVELSKTVPDSATKLAKAYYQIVSAGYDGADAMDLLAQSSKLATAGVTDTFIAADALTSVMNAYGDAAGTAEDISDKFFKIVELGKINMQQLGSQISTVSGLAAQAGVGFTDLSAVIAKGVKTQKPEQFFTGLRGVLTAVIKPTEDATKVAEELGIVFNSKELQSKGLVQFMLDLQEATDGNVDSLASLFPNVRGLGAFLAATTSAGGELVDVLNELENASGSTQKALDIQLETADNRIKILTNTIMAKLKPAGDVMVVAVGNMAKSISDKLNDPVKAAEINIQRLTNEFNRNSDVLINLSQKTNRTAAEQKVLAETLGTLQKEYPDYFSNLDAETLKHEDVAKAINLTRAALENKFIAERKFAEQKGLLNKQLDIEIRRNELIKLRAREEELVNKQLEASGLVGKDILTYTREEIIAYASINKQLKIYDKSLKDNETNLTDVKTEISEIDRIYGEIIRKQESVGGGINFVVPDLESLFNDAFDEIDGEEDIEIDATIKINEEGRPEEYIENFKTRAISGLADIGNSIQSNISDQLADAFLGGKLAFDDMFEYILKMLISQTIQNAFLSLIPGGIGGLFSGIFGNNSVGGSGSSPQAPTVNNSFSLPSLPSAPNINLDNASVVRAVNNLNRSIQAMNMNQVNRGVTLPPIIIKSQLDSQRFIVEQDNTRSRMVQGGYNAKS